MMPSMVQQPYGVPTTAYVMPGSQVVYQQQAPGTMATTSPMKSKQEPPAHPGRAAAARDTVHYMHRQMEDVEAAIQALQTENERLKWKLLGDRKAQLEKYFMCDDHLLKQAVAGEWKRIMEVLRRMRDVDSVESMRAQDRYAYEQRCAELDLQLKETNNRIAQVEQEKADIRSQLERAEAMIRTVGERMTAYPLPANQPKFAAYPGEAYMKSKLHELLKDVDSNYKPPMNPGQ